MSWEIALIVSSVVSAGATVAKGVTTSNALVKKAGIERSQAVQNADLAALSAVQDERARRQEFAIWDSKGLAESFYDGPSWTAIRGEGEENLDADVASLQMKGRIQHNRWLATAESKKIEAKAAAQSKWFSVVDAGGQLFKGAYMADQYKPGDKSLLERMVS